MNWKRGFGRIVFVIATFVAFITAGLIILFILTSHRDAKQMLMETRFAYYNKYGYVGFRETEDLVSFVPDNPTKSQMDIYKARLAKKYKTTKELLGQTQKVDPNGHYMLDPNGHYTLDDLLALTTPNSIKEQILAISNLLDLENGFWVNLSTIGLFGICSAAGLGGGISGFLIVWVLYKLIEWLVLGFCDNNRLHSEKT